MSIIPSHELQSITESVIAFVHEMNDWERIFYAAWADVSKQYVHDAPDEVMAAYRAKDEAVQSRHDEKYRLIFNRYCTLRPRAYGGPDLPHSAGIPTQYQGVDENAFLSADAKSKNRVEVVFQTSGTVVNYKFMFVVLKKMDGWRIDSYKYQFINETKWNNGIL